MEPKCRVWVVFGEKMKLGDGRAHLLELIDELGSLRQAVAQIGMSYRNAWGYLRDLEKAAGFKLLERRPGGGPKGGMQLTQDGRDFLAKYRRFRTHVDTVVERQFARIFSKK
ncbi:MAG: LysR family transcriptional regulator [candidate division NC10 bacterium]|nr:LysR family transcriptional regulator [candidate division NC10 bacterium]